VSAVQPTIQPTRSVQDTWCSLGIHMASIPPDHKWISFSARSDHLLDACTYRESYFVVTSSGFLPQVQTVSLTQHRRSHHDFHFSDLFVHLVPLPVLAPNHTNFT
jgi:hypothetical protein